MAAGFSSRMNTDKLMLDFQGKPMLERVIQAAVKSKIDDIVLVYRDHNVKALAENYNISLVYNDEAHMGQSSSMKVGIKKSNSETDAFIFLVGDQPFLTSGIIDNLIHTYDIEGSRIIVPKYNGKNGNPVIFPISYVQKLLSINGDSGGRKIIREENENVTFVHIDNPVLGVDMDTLEEYKKWNSKRII
jgi:molybdenum cofactor cytidylyltransferase